MVTHERYATYSLEHVCYSVMLYVADKWLIIDEDIPPLDYLIIEGGLSAAADASLQFTLDVNYIIISGRLAIGWENDPFNGTAKIILRGEHSTPAYSASNGPELGAKFIGMCSLALLSRCDTLSVPGGVSMPHRPRCGIRSLLAVHKYSNFFMPISAWWCFVFQVLHNGVRNVND